MIADFDRETLPGEPFDVCIVGSGAAGIAIARTFIGAGLRVIVLESGGPRADDATTDLQRSLVEGRPHAGVHSGRARCLGGTTTLWGGQALPLQAIDFEPRPWVPQSGWPIRLSDLQPHFAGAAEVMQLRETRFDASIPHFRGRSIPEFASGTLDYGASQWSPVPDFARAWRGQLESATDVQVWQRANVVEIVPATDGTRIDHLKLRSLSGRTAELRARFHILCVGGIETARLLLASRSVQPAGVGNGHDQVGRNFQDHISVRCGWLHPLDRPRLHDAFDLSYDRGVKYYPKLLASPELQRRERMLNAIGNVVTEIAPDSLTQRLKDVARAVLHRRWDPVARGPVRWQLREWGALLGAGWRFAAQRRAFTPRTGRVWLEAHLEQEPSAESRITLAAECDALGVPRTKVSWKPTAASWRTARAFAREVGEEFQRLGLARFESILPNSDDDAEWTPITGDLNHHIGTARMSDSPEHGVVDARGRVHGLPNLYVASSAVFPTGGSSNPTFTLLALALRIAADVRGRCAQP